MKTHWAVAVVFGAMAAWATPDDYYVRAWVLGLSTDHKSVLLGIGESWDGPSELQILDVGQSKPRRTLAIAQV